MSATATNTARLTGAAEQAAEQQTDWWKFNITDEQAKAWQNGDINAAKQFYNENEKLLFNIALHYIHGSRVYQMAAHYSRAIYLAFKYYSPEEALHQIYADMPLYRFWNGKKLYYCVFRSCVFVAYGGYAGQSAGLSAVETATSLDKLLREDGSTTLADLIPDYKTIDDYVDVNPVMAAAFEKALENIAQVLYPRPKDELKRIAFMRRF